MISKLIFSKMSKKTVFFMGLMSSLGFYDKMCISGLYIYCQKPLLVKQEENGT